MKAYGRAPNFLVLTGYEQVRSIACALTGDAGGAGRVDLTLPATGVCSAASIEDASSSCCAPISLGAPTWPPTPSDRSGRPGEPGTPLDPARRLGGRSSN